MSRHGLAPLAEATEVLLEEVAHDDTPISDARRR
jgi:hypothetical protein